MNKYLLLLGILFFQLHLIGQNADTLENKGALQEVTIRGLKAKSGQPITFTNINKKEIERQNFGQDLPFLLNLTPSVVVNSDAGAGVGYTGIRIRGTDPTRTNVTINGIPINDAESQGTFWVNMPDLASSTQSIQVQRGVGTSTNGAAAFGASINIETMQGDIKPYTELSTSYGSFNTQKYMSKIGTGLLDKKWAIDARLSAIKSDGFIDRASSDLSSFFVSGTYYGAKSSLKMNVFTGKEKTYQAWNGVSEELLKAGNRTHNDFTYSNQTDNYQQDHYQLFYAYQFNQNWSAQLGLHYTHGEGYYEEYKSDELFTTYRLPDTLFVQNDTITSGDFVRRRWLDNDFYGTVFSVSYQKGNWNIIAGGALNRYDGRHFGELIWAEYSQGSFINDTFYRGTSKKVEGSGYVKMNYQLRPSLSAFVDLQVRAISYTGKGEDLNGSTYLPYDFNLPYTFFNPKLGLTYQVSNQGNIYAYMGIAHREPVRNDIIQASNTSIPKPEQLINYELGYRKNGKKYAITVNGYYMYYQNQLVNTGQLNDVGAYNRVNVDQSYRAGIELTGGLQLIAKLRWDVTTTYSQNRIQAFTEYLDDYNNGTQVAIQHQNKSIAFSPNWIASSLFTYSVFKGFEIQFISKYVGKQYLDNTESETRKLDAFLVNDLRLNHEMAFTELDLKIRIGLMVNNLFNEEYEPNGATYPGGISGGQRTDYNYYYPQAGRNVLANVTVVF